MEARKRRSLVVASERTPQPRVLVALLLAQKHLQKVVTPREAGAKRRVMREPDPLISRRPAPATRSQHRRNRPIHRHGNEQQRQVNIRVHEELARAEAGAVAQ